MMPNVTLIAAVAERCPYLVWGGPKDYKECDTLSEAMEYQARFGGTIYHPYGTRPTPDEHKAKMKKTVTGRNLPNEVLCSRCRRRFVSSRIEWHDEKPWHPGYLKMRLTKMLTAQERQAMRKAQESGHRCE